MIDSSEFLNQILEGYRTNYDVTDFGDDHDGYLKASAHMHVSHGQHLVLKEFEMWSADEDEYVYFFAVPHLTDMIAKEIISEAYEDGYPRIRLDHVSFKHQHMCTKLVCIVLYESADDTAMKIIRKCRIYKSFQFSLKGWMEMHTVALDLNDGKISSNSYGRDTAKFLKRHVDHYVKHEKSNKII